MADPRPIPLWPVFQRDHDLARGLVFGYVPRLGNIARPREHARRVGEGVNFAFNAGHFENFKGHIGLRGASGRYQTFANCESVMSRLNNFTAAVQAKQNQSGTYWLLSKGNDSAATAHSFMLGRVVGTGAVTRAIVGCSTNEVIFDVANVTTAVQTLMVTKMGTTVKVFLDGTLKGTGTLGTDVTGANADPLAVSGRSDGTQGSTSLFCGGWVWDRAFTEDEAKQWGRDPAALYVPRRKFWMVSLSSGTLVLAGSSTLTITSTASATDNGVAVGASTLAITPTGAATAAGVLVGSASFSISSSAAASASGVAVGTATLTVSSAAAASGTGVAAGSATLAITPTAAASAAGVAVGASTMAIAVPAAELSVPGVLVGASTATITASGAATGSAAAAGAATLTIAGAAAATANGAAAGTSTLALTSSAAMTAQGVLAGTTTATLTTTAAPAGTGVLVGSTTLTFDAVLLSGGSIAGDTSLTITATGTMTGTGVLAAAATLSLTATGAATATGALAGSSTASLASAGAATASGVAVGSASLSLAGSGTVSTPSTPLSGSTSFALSVGAASLDVAGALAGAASLQLLSGGAALRGVTGVLAGTSTLVFVGTGLLHYGVPVDHVLVRRVSGVVVDASGDQVQEPQPIDWPLEEDGLVELVLVTQDGQAYNLTGSLLEIGIGRPGSAPALQRAAVVLDAVGGVARWEFVAEDFADLKARLAYHYDVQLTDQDGKRWQVVPASSWRPVGFRPT